MTAELHTLTGAYVLDALSNDERAAFERHLADCAACSQEVDELRETSTRLAAAVTARAPESLRADVLARVGQIRQDAPVVALRRRWPLAVTAVAAAAVIAAVVFGVQAAGMSAELDQTRSQLAAQQRGGAALTAVLGAPDARVVAGSGGSVVMSPRLERFAFVPRGLQPPAPGRTYQMWLTDSGGRHSAGVMSDVSHAVVAAMQPGTRTFDVTVEPAGGSPRPTTESILTLPLA